MAKSARRLQLEQLLGEEETTRLIWSGYVFDVLTDVLREKVPPNAFNEVIGTVDKRSDRAAIMLEIAVNCFTHKEMLLAFTSITTLIEGYQSRLLK
jgi:hypothetical protein